MKICFWGEIANALRGKTIGGGELQMALLARSLAKAGHEVVVIDPFTDETFVTEEGIKIIHVSAWNKGWPGIRLFWYRIPAFYKLFIEQKADFYYVRMRSYYHLVAYLAARKIKANFIIGLAHDFDVLGFGYKFRYDYRTRFNLLKFLTLDLPNDLVFNYILRRSDYVTFQHSGQQLPHSPIHGKTAIFPNIIDYGKIPQVQNPSKDYFIAVGSLTMIKGAGNLYRLIRSIDRKCRFVIVGEPKGRRAKKLYKQLEKFENVTLKGRLSHPETLEMIANAKALVNTSKFEGFPNIFLEAWACGVPVISLKVNPGNVINEHGLGICCDGDLKRMKEIIETDEIPSWSKLHFTAYIRRYHDFLTSEERFVSILKQAQ